MSMNKKLLSLAALLAAMHANAQDSTFKKQLDEVVVTASKYERKASETGKVITVIDRATIDRSLGKDLSQLLTEQAGLIINGATSNPGKDKSVFLRGASSDYTVILVNGIPVSDPTGVGGAFDLRLFPMEQIERIEILKGAQSTLYGSDAIAGVINIITRKGSNKPAELFGNIGFGSYNTFNASAGLTGAADKLRYTIGYMHHESRGISEALDTNAVKTFDKDGFLRNSFNVDIDGEVMDNLHVMPFFRYSYFRGGYDGGSFMDANYQFKTSALTAGTRVSYKYKDLQLTGQYQYNKVDRSYDAYPFDGNTQLAEIFGQYTINKNVDVLAGVDYRYQQVLNKDMTPADPTIEMTSPYASVFLKNLGGFYLEAGGRFNKNSRYGDNWTYSFNPSYLINSDIKVFANLASAFKAPTLESLYGTFGANPDLKPEKSTTWEGGVQASFFNNFIDVRAVYFNREVKDVIVYRTSPSAKLMNFNKQKDHGFELEPTININKDIQVKLYYTFLDGELHTNTGTGKDTAYNNLIRRPKHSFGGTIGYAVTKHLFVSTTVYNYTKRYDLAFDNNPPYGSVQVELGAYALWNAYAEYKLLNNRIRIFADLKNITNTKFQEIYGYGTLGTNITAGLAVRL
jgi:vitamin B12 transporter